VIAFDFCVEMYVNLWNKQTRVLKVLSAGFATYKFTSGKLEACCKNILHSILKTENYA